MLSVIFAVLGAVCLVLAGRDDGWARIALLVGAAATMLLRLLCNMLDGMIAVEGGLQSPTGEIYNELPDRLADLLFLAGAGYAIPDIARGAELGWAAAAVALLTAYVRTLGVSAGAAQHFTGPMAKPTRMHVLIAACLLSAVATAAGWRSGWLLAAALVVVIAGGVVTIARRLRLIAADLKAA
jgi:phosphatidylglycerophosphate synthase